MLYSLVLIWLISSILPLKALNNLCCADVPLSNYLLTYLLTHSLTRMAETCCGSYINKWSMLGNQCPHTNKVLQAAPIPHLAVDQHLSTCSQHMVILGGWITHLESPHEPALGPILWVFPCLQTSSKSFCMTSKKPKRKLSVSMTWPGWKAPNAVRFSNRHWNWDELNSDCSTC